MICIQSDTNFFPVYFLIGASGPLFFFDCSTVSNVDSSPREMFDL